MKWTIDDVPVFVAVIDHNGFTAAARALDMPKSTVSKAVSRLEEALGLRLLDRNSRSLRITAEGETFYRQALLIMEQVRETDAAMAGLNAVPSGRLIVSLPPAFCQEIVSPNLAAFHRDYPQVDLELVITSHGTDILRDQIDIAVVVGPQEDSDLICRTLFAGPLIWVASPDYLSQCTLGDSPDDLLKHIRICETRYGLRRVPFHLNGQADHFDLARGITHVNDPLSVRKAIVCGAGVSLLPELYCRQQLRDGSLVEVFRNISLDLSASKLSVVYPSRRLMSPKARVLLEFLDRICKA
ncbi:LysR family transcriptional regulator [Roseibium sp.]|uniref:LysR family transcriptional regulator n=1 Tax=Roseibium sp. TaxID=1936156 RepID=UPI003A977B36